MNLKILNSENIDDIVDNICFLHYEIQMDKANNNFSDISKKRIIMVDLLQKYAQYNVGEANKYMKFSSTEFIEDSKAIT